MYCDWINIQYEKRFTYLKKIYFNARSSPLIILSLSSARLTSSKHAPSSSLVKLALWLYTCNTRTAFSVTLRRSKRWSILSILCCSMFNKPPNEYHSFEIFREAFSISLGERRVVLVTCCEYLSSCFIESNPSSPENKVCKSL